MKNTNHVNPMNYCAYLIPFLATRANCLAMFCLYGMNGKRNTLHDLMLAEQTGPSNQLVPIVLSQR